MTDPTPGPIPGLPAGFTANNFTPEMEEVYLRTFRALRRESEARPGLTTLQAMVNERAAHTFTRLKSWDASSEPVYQMDYDRMARAFNEAVKSILASAKDDDTADVTIRMAMNSMTESFLRAVDDSVEDGLITDDDRSALLRRFRRHLEDSLPG